MRWIKTALLAALLAATPEARAQLDLSRAVTTRLANGLRLIVLEERTRPLVSVQMLYTVGARNEQVGQTGMAHFLEHMAFRATEHFPDTEVVSAIYAVGGEWHGYTWLDQTTYFETAPAEHLDLLLRIEADRMTRLLIPADEVEAERGAVLAEMHGYENDPASRLKDALLTVSFLQHPYRNNTIGWESDVDSISHQDLVDFYRRHYRPANAVLAVVGDVSQAEVAARVGELFGGVSGGPPSPPPPTVEPPQTGLRRIEIEGPGRESRFEVAYRGPAVTDPDYPAFLLLQGVLGGGSGINFLQNEWGDSALPGSRLAGLADDLVTWFIPTAFPYVFTIAGSLRDGAARGDLEAHLEEAIAAVRSQPPTAAELDRVRRSLLDELVFDLETTEDAAHQLAYFAGIGAAELPLELPRRLEAVTPRDIQSVAQRFLAPHQRTIGWYLAGDRPPARSASATADRAPVRSGSEAPAPPREAAPMRPSPPRMVRLAGGLPVLLQRNPMTPAAHLRLLFPSTALDLPGKLSIGSPIWRHSALDFRFRSRDLATVIGRARDALTQAVSSPPPPAEEVMHPGRRLARELDEVLGVAPVPSPIAPVAISLVGDLEEGIAVRLLEEAFGEVAPPRPAFPPLAATGSIERIELPSPPAQAQLGYVVSAPRPSSPEAAAWQLLLYVLSHGYEGRLGKEAITRRGLVYYIDADYSTDGINGRVSLGIGVDPPKLSEMQALLQQMLQGLQSTPPTAAELAEAKRHLLGRRVSRAQSNEEVSRQLLSDWIGYRRLLRDDEFASRVEAVTLEQLHRILEAFVAGSIVVVDH